MSKKLFLSAITIGLALMTACNKEESITNSENFEEIFEAYDIEDVDVSNVSDSVYNHLQTIETTEQLLDVIDFIKSPTKLESASYNEDSLKGMYRAKGQQPNGIAMVWFACRNQSDGESVSVIRSEFYLTGIWSSIMEYQHTGQSRLGFIFANRAHFFATGHMLVKVATKGITLKSIPCSINGYYDFNTQMSHFDN